MIFKNEPHIWFCSYASQDCFMFFSFRTFSVRNRGNNFLKYSRVKKKTNSSKMQRKNGINFFSDQIANLIKKLNN